MRSCVDFHGRIAVGPLREAFLRSGLPLSLVCDRLGWIDSRGRPETTRLARALGIKPCMTRGHNRVATSIGIDRATAIMRALDDVDPWDVGL